MFKRDEDGALVGFIGIIAIILFIIYILILLATAIAGVAAAGGTLFGGFEAVKNYFLSFKENVIDSNRISTMGA